MRFETKWALTELGESLDAFLIEEAITGGDLTARRAALESMSGLQEGHATRALIAKLGLD